MADSSAKKWLKGCGIGCGVLVVLVILGTVGGSFFVLRPFRAAVKTREILDERFGDQADYQPAADGAILDERMKAFLVVRVALMEHCGEFAETDQQLARLDDLEDDASRKEVFGAVFILSRTMMGMGSVMGEFFAARNSALLDAGMGRGEYTYIYLLAFHDDLIALLEGDGDSAIFGAGPTRRAHQAMTQVLRNQQKAVAAPDNGLDEVSQAAIQEALAEEIRKLGDDAHHLLWQDGLPPAIAASIAPYRERLDELFCVQTVGLEFTRNRTRVLGIQGD